MTSTCRVARLPDDFDRWDDLLGLIRQAFAYMDEVIDPPSSAKLLDETGLRQKARDEVCFVATSGATMIGCVFAAIRQDRIYIGKFAVSNAWRGRGVGRNLLEAVERLARTLNKPILELQTRVELTDNHAAFARLGFTEQGRTAHPGYHRPTAVTMRKILA